MCGPSPVIDKINLFYVLRLYYGTKKKDSESGRDFNASFFCRYSLFFFLGNIYFTLNVNGNGFQIR